MAMAKKEVKLGVKEEKKPEKKVISKNKKFFLFDINDRFFTKETDGVTLQLKANERQEVSEETADLLKKKYDYLKVIEE